MHPRFNRTFILMIKRKCKQILVIVFMPREGRYHTYIAAGICHKLQ